jgi:cellobiose phosphorylase
MRRDVVGGTLGRMKFGHFDPAEREYVITRPDTPRSWSNYLGDTRYGAIITNHAGGYSFYRSSVQGRFTRLVFNAVPADQPGRTVYLRDQETGEFWSNGWQPVGRSLDEYTSECRHGTGYTRITSTCAQIRSESTYFVPLGQAFECWIIRVNNTSDRPRKLRLFTYVEYATDWHLNHDQHNLQYAQYITQCRLVDTGAGPMVSHAMCPHLPEDPGDFANRDQARYSFLGLVGTSPTGHDLDREAFIGPYRGYSNPLTVERGEAGGSEASGDNGCGCLQIDLDLAPGAEESFVVVMGVGKADREGVAAVRAISTVDGARAELGRLRTHWHGRTDAMRCLTPDPDFDAIVNDWNPYNCHLAFAWSRAASLVYSGDRDGYGFRDTLQDMLGVISQIPDEARERLELMITGQYRHGGGMPVVPMFGYEPGDVEVLPDEALRADDGLWLFNAVPMYVNETGDTGFYDKTLPFADEGEASVYEHLRRALDFNLERTGRHGLPCGLSADWNDCLRFGTRGESVFVAMQLRFALATFRDIAEQLDREPDATWAGSELHALDQRLHTHAWDGAWFRRGFREDGSTVGSTADEEGQIFLNPQAWAVLSGLTDETPERATQAMDAVNERLMTECGLKLCDPPFRRVHHDVIRAVLFGPGMKENAGIFNHTQGWAVIAETRLGRNDRAWAICKSFLPSSFNERAEVRQVEPYVHCQSTHGPDSPRYGAGRLPWLTGTAAWAYVATTQYVLGIRPELEGLRIDPCIPTDWPGFHVSRRFRGATYQIEVDNAARTGRGVVAITIDGRSHDPGRPVAPAARGATVSVQVTLGDA